MPRKRQPGRKRAKRPSITVYDTRKHTIVTRRPSGYATRKRTIVRRRQFG